MNSTGNELKAVLRRYLRLETSLDEVRVLLGPSWRFERDGEDFRLGGDLVFDEPIRFGLEDVGHAIDLALVSGADLQEWGNLLIMSDSYEPAPDLSEDELDQLLGIVHELASPLLHGGSDREGLLNLRDRLRQASS
ncbi:MAG TPA: hypothetical protein VGR02_02425 [Thermoanaerobaculia bacterium]|jgi:hypothetical protein|nr:hypothetical protein [Thermoanaerobaculia bacterium]